MNAVNLLQSVGFATRPVDPQVNRVLGLAIMALAAPASAALLGYVRARAHWRFLIGPIVFDAFVLFAVIVDYVLGVEFRSPRQPSVLIPYLVLFFGAIVLMGMPMYRVDRRLWAVTAATSAALVVSMLYAMSQGVG